MPLVDIITWSFLAGLVIAFGFVVKNYAKGLAGSPRELWLMYGYKFLECAAYKAIQLSLVLWLSKDCGLGDVSAGSFITGYSLICSAMGMVVGALVDTAGIKRVMLLSIGLLLGARFFMSWLTEPTMVFILGFMPMALGFAIVAPVTSVGIKKFTTKESAALGFSLFYVLINVGFATGGFLFDKARQAFALRDAAGTITNEAYGLTLFGQHFSTYQLIFGFGTCVTLVSLLLALPMRDGVERTESGVSIEPAPPRKFSLTVITDTLHDTLAILKTVARERYFWTFLSLIGMLVFVRSVFVQWDYILPKYSVRVLGEGAKVGAIASVLNSVLVVLLVPLIAPLVKRVKSYELMTYGSALSAASCFIAVIPESFFAPLTQTIFGELVFIKWLGIAGSAAELAAHPPSPMYWALIFSIALFTVGEAIWSPRLYQFTMEIAPKGKEATYLSLAVLPTFASKFFVGPMSGLLLNAYTPVDAAGKILPHPSHHLIWVWIGVSAVITPLGLFLCHGWFHRQTSLHKPVEA